MISPPGRTNLKTVFLKKEGGLKRSIEIVFLTNKGDWTDYSNVKPLGN